MSKVKESIPAGELKAHCAQILDRVSRTGSELIITRHGKPVARLLPIKDGRKSRVGFARGCITIHADLIEPIDVAWEASG